MLACIVRGTPRKRLVIYLITKQILQTCAIRWIEKIPKIGRGFPGGIRQNGSYGIACEWLILWLAVVSWCNLRRIEHRTKGSIRNMSVWDKSAVFSLVLLAFLFYLIELLPEFMFDMCS